MKLKVLTSNLSGEAEDYYRTLDREDRRSWEKVTEHLKQKYGEGNSTRRDKALADCNNLSQGKTKARDYVRKAQRMWDVLGKSWDRTVAEKIAEGLNNIMVRTIIKAKDGSLTFESAARTILQTDGTKEDKDNKEDKDEEATHGDDDKVAIVRYLAKVTKSQAEVQAKSSEERDRAMAKATEDCDHLFPKAITKGLGKLSLRADGMPGPAVGYPAWLYAGGSRPTIVTGTGPWYYSCGGVGHLAYECQNMFD